MVSRDDFIQRFRNGNRKTFDDESYLPEKLCKERGVKMLDEDV
jgi:hypothetical protein